MGELVAVSFGAMKVGSDVLCQGKYGFSGTITDVMKDSPDRAAVAVAKVVTGKNRDKEVPVTLQWQPALQKWHAETVERSVFVNDHYVPPQATARLREMQKAGTLVRKPKRVKLYIKPVAVAPVAQVAPDRRTKYRLAATPKAPRASLLAARLSYCEELLFDVTKTIQAIAQELKQ